MDHAAVRGDGPVVDGTIDARACFIPSEMRTAPVRAVSGGRPSDASAESRWAAFGPRGHSAVPNLVAGSPLAAVGRAEIGRLKARDGKHMVRWGSLSLAQEMTASPGGSPGAAASSAAAEPAASDVAKRLAVQVGPGGHHRLGRPGIPCRQTGRHVGRKDEPGRQPVEPPDAPIGHDAATGSVEV